MRKIIFAMAGLTMVFVLGCASTPRTIPLTASGEDRISPSDFVNVALAKGVAEREEISKGPFGVEMVLLRFSTGPIWRRVFIGAEDAPATFEIVSTQMNQVVAGVGFVGRLTYEVQAILIVGDKKYPITARGERSAAMMIESARRQSVELAVVDAAQQAAGILAAIKK